MVVSKGNVNVFPSPLSRCPSSTQIPLSAKSMRRNCDRVTPRLAQMLPTFPSITSSGGYHDGCGVDRIRIEISRPSASKSKCESSRELMFAHASFCASSARYDAVSTRHHPRRTNRSLDPSQTSDKYLYDTRRFSGSLRHRLFHPLAGEDKQALHAVSVRGRALYILGLPLRTAIASPQHSHVGSTDAVLRLLRDVWTFRLDFEDSAARH